MVIIFYVQLIACRSINSPRWLPKGELHLQMSSSSSHVRQEKRRKLDLFDRRNGPLTILVERRNAKDIHASTDTARTVKKKTVFILFFFSPFYLYEWLVIPEWLIALPYIRFIPVSILLLLTNYKSKLFYRKRTFRRVRVQYETFPDSYSMYFRVISS